EMAGDALYCHIGDARAVFDSLQGCRDLSCLMRPANLEDVFLKLTGRELRD
ncbi:MAG: ABC transporter ATP-binding protein, partial [Magnetococcales bacterium]|nr:ABC transporter ATP-binding protein [Magnetococcales bacterium]